MRLVIIGGGRVGKAIGRLASERGYEIGEVVCRTRPSAARAVKFIGSGVPQAAADCRLLPADLILISTPDDRIGDAIATISRGYVGPNFGSAARAKRRAAKPVVLHTSGALSSQVLDALRPQGFSVGSCHPLQTFENPTSAMKLIGESFFCIEGDARAVRAARKLATSIGGTTFQVPTEKKSLYHAAAVLGSPGVIALISISLEALGRCGLDARTARAALIPLVSGTIKNIEALGPARALTGPVRRGDVTTIKRNLDALAAVNKQWATLYAELTERALKLKSELPENNQKASEIRALLSKAGVGGQRRRTGKRKL